MRSGRRALSAALNSSSSLRISCRACVSVICSVGTAGAPCPPRNRSRAGTLLQLKEENEGMKRRSSMSFFEQKEQHEFLLTEKGRLNSALIQHFF
jgi:hypothetical protein